MARPLDGGCVNARARSTTTETASAAAAAISGAPRKRAASMPSAAAMRFPRISARGLAYACDGDSASSVAEAPSGATRKGASRICSVQIAGPPPTTRSAISSPAKIRAEAAASAFMAIHPKGHGEESGRRRFGDALPVARDDLGLVPQGLLRGRSALEPFLPGEQMREVLDPGARPLVPQRRPHIGVEHGELLARQPG